MYVLKQQELAYDAPESHWMFNPIGKHLDVTPGAGTAIGPELGTLLAIVHEQARLRNGLDALQIFQSSESGADDLFVIENADVIIMVMASDYVDRVNQFIDHSE